jgi:predicted nicotinamide N-methyase
MAPRQEEVQQFYSQHPGQPFPFWTKLWPSARALAAWLQQNPTTLKGKTVLEIAGGLGLPSLVAARYAARVCCTDKEAAAVEAVRLSAAHAGTHQLQCDVLNWQHLPPDLGAEILLLSDVNYAPAEFAALQILLQHFLAKGSTIILATPQRLVGQAFVAQVRDLVFEQSVLTIGDEQGEHPISLLVLKS